MKYSSLSLMFMLMSAMLSACGGARTGDEDFAKLRAAVRLGDRADEYVSVRRALENEASWWEPMDVSSTSCAGFWPSSGGEVLVKVTLWGPDSISEWPRQEWSYEYLRRRASFGARL